MQSHCSNRELSPEVRDALSSLRDRGYHVVENFWSEDFTEMWREKLESHFHTEESFQAGTQPGARRWGEVEEKFPELVEHHSGNSFIREVVGRYQGTEQCHNVCYQTSFVDPSVSELIDAGKTLEIGLGRGWHSDQWWNGLKTILFLTDIGAENGPFTFVPMTHRLSFDSLTAKRLRKFWKVIPPEEFDSSQLHFSSAEAKGLALDSVAEPILGKKGTLAFVDTRGLHHAEPVRAGERRVLWGYFS